MSTRDPNRDTDGARGDAMTRLVRYFDALQARVGGDGVGIEMSPRMHERLAEELDLSQGRLQEAIKDALEDRNLEQFAFPDTLVTEAGELHTGDRHPILWMWGHLIEDASDPRGGA